MVTGRLPLRESTDRGVTARVSEISPLPPQHFAGHERTVASGVNQGIDYRTRILVRSEASRRDPQGIAVPSDVPVHCRRTGRCSERRSAERSTGLSDNGQRGDEAEQCDEAPASKRGRRGGPCFVPKGHTTRLTEVRITTPGWYATSFGAPSR